MSDEGSSPGDEPRSVPATDIPTDGPTDGATVWRRADGTAYVGSEERAVVLDLDHLDRQPYVFEGTAAQVWVCLDGDRSESEIVDDLAEAYEVPREVVLDGVREFIERLRDLGLIVRDANA